MSASSKGPRKPAARMGDLTAHAGSIASGSGNVKIGKMQAARVGDLQLCPQPLPKPHLGGPITEGSSTVFIGGAPAARKGDACDCTFKPEFPKDKGFDWGGLAKDVARDLIGEFAGDFGPLFGAYQAANLAYQLGENFAEELKADATITGLLAEGLAILAVAYEWKGTVTPFYDLNNPKLEAINVVLQRHTRERIKDATASMKKLGTLEAKKKFYEDKQREFERAWSEFSPRNAETQKVLKDVRQLKQDEVLLRILNDAKVDRKNDIPPDRALVDVMKKLFKGRNLRATIRNRALGAIPDPEPYGMHRRKLPMLDMKRYQKRGMAEEGSVYRQLAEAEAKALGGDLDPMDYLNMIVEFKKQLGANADMFAAMIAAAPNSILTGEESVKIGG